MFELYSGAFITEIEKVCLTTRSPRGQEQANC